jgi:WD40 repeat protein
MILASPWPPLRGQGGHLTLSGCQPRPGPDAGQLGPAPRPDPRSLPGSFLLGRSAIPRRRERSLRQTARRQSTADLGILACLRISPALHLPGQSADQGDSAVRAIAFHPDGAWLATGRTASIGHVWEWLPGKQAPLVHRNYVNSVDFSPDGRRLITGSGDQQARIWDLPLSCQRGTPLVKSNPALSLAYLDPSLVAGGPRTRISARQGRPIPHWVWEYLCAAFSPDGRLVVTGSQDNQARVWEVATGRLVGKALPYIRASTGRRPRILVLLGYLISASDTQPTLIGPQFPVTRPGGR